jgi:CysZ protein
VLLLNIVALLLAFLIPGIGLVLGWMIAAYAIGRGLFVAVAMRRMPREVAESAYAAHRFTVLLTGGVLAAAAYVPFANLLIPVIGVAAMVHVLDVAMSGDATGYVRPPTPM